jgi:hypothetical protein
MSEKIAIPGNDYIGAIKLNSKWRFFYEYLAMWILDHEAYSGPPPSSPDAWRFGLWQVNATNAAQYCESMKERELTANQIPHIFYEEFPPYPQRRAELTFVVNFDEQIFINGWKDNIMIHEYAPSGWKAIEDNPYDYVPQEIRALWGK